ARFFVLATSRGRSVAGRANRRPVSDDDPDFQRLISVQVKKESLIWVAPRDVGAPAAKFRSQGPRETPDAEHVLQARWDRALPALSARELRIPELPDGDGPGRFHRTQPVEWLRLWRQSGVASDSAHAEHLAAAESEANFARRPHRRRRGRNLHLALA